MFEGDWSNYDPSKFPEIPSLYPDLLHDYYDPVFCMPDSSVDMQFFTKRREEDGKEINGLLYNLPEWQLDRDQVFQQVTENNESEREGNRPRTLEMTTAVHYQLKQVGPLSTEERQAKIQRYLAKRQRRNFHKKVVYLCRKRVADTRLRVKGRFVAKQLAAELQGLENDKNNVDLPKDLAVLKEE